MAVSAKTKTVMREITQGERDLRDWHRNLRLGAAGASFGMMLASLYQLHWAGTLIGFPSFAAAAMAGSLEILLAFNAGAVTSIRKRTPDGQEAGYFWSLWAIFGFLLCISVAANVGHAVVALSEWFASGAAPAVMVEHKMWVYGVGSAVAAMVPLGGSFGLHISGFVRKNGAGSDWSDSSGTAAVVSPGAVVPVVAPRAPAEARGKPAASRRREPSAQRSPMWVGQGGAPERQPDLEAVAAPAAAPESSPSAPVGPVPVEALVPAPASSSEQPAPAKRAEGGVEELRPDLPFEERRELLYEEWRAAMIAGEEHRFRQGGDLNGSKLGLRLGKSDASGRNTIRPWFESRFAEEQRAPEAAASEERQLAIVG
ncbi:hypothetical protein ACIQ9R_36355 [Streptomyces sp. NPDC094447]|uniref:hypothetical protein n=1 Tax=Streptomyces sp. NPDC094447 TaxID=3366062 RepID=UPI0038053C5F